MRMERVDARWGLMLLRVMMSAIVLVSGIQKWSGGIGGTVNFFTSLGIPLPQVMAPVIATGEVIGGLLLLAGILSRPVAVWFIAEFLVTTFVAKLPRAGWDAARIDMLMLTGAVVIALCGAGAFAFDAASQRIGPRRTAPAV
ncbi:MAG: DoxX family protein [Chloroflexota bacterium]